MLLKESKAPAVWMLLLSLLFLLLIFLLIFFLLLLLPLHLLLLLQDPQYNDILFIKNKTNIM